MFHNIKSVYTDQCSRKVLLHRSRSQHPGTRPAHVRRPCWEGSGLGLPLPVAGASVRGYHPRKIFETETTVGAFLRIQRQKNEHDEKVIL